jgi:hypothetical protein
MEIDPRDHVRIETLARETGASISDVEQIYKLELEHFETVAKIRTYVPLIAWRQACLKLKNANH